MASISDVKHKDLSHKSPTEGEVSCFHFFIVQCLKSPESQDKTIRRELTSACCHFSVPHTHICRGKMGLARSNAHIKETRMVVVSLRGVNYRIQSSRLDWSP